MTVDTLVLIPNLQQPMKDNYIVQNVLILLKVRFHNQAKNQFSLFGNSYEKSLLSRKKDLGLYYSTRY